MLTLTPGSKVFLDKIIVAHLVKKFPTFYGTPKFIPYSQEITTRPCPHPN
jgi:hypothetical protein